MRQKLLLALIALLSTTLAWADVEINETNFPDENFRNWVLSQDYGADGVLTDAEIASVKRISVSDKSIQSLKGIEYFTALTDLYCGDNQLTSLDVSQNTALMWLWCYANQLTSLDVSHNTKLTYLSCYKNQINNVAMDALVESLPTVNSGTLRVIYNENEQNEITFVQMAAAKAKGWITKYYDGNSWQEYGLAINETTFTDANFRSWLLSQEYGADGVLTDAEIGSVTRINVSGKSIQSLKGIEYFTALTNLSCGGNQLTSLDVSGCTSLTNLSCFSNQLTSLDISGCIALTNLYCDNNQLTELDVSQNTALQTLYCSVNQLTSLDVSQNTKLTTLVCYKNQIKGAAMDALVESLPTVSEGEMIVIYYENEQNEMTAEQVTAAKAKGWKTYEYDGGTWWEYAGNDVVGIAIDATNFPDANFRDYLLSESYGRSGVLTDAKIASVTSINVSGKSIQSLKGIEYFTALTGLKCDNNQLTELDVSQNTALTVLKCDNNQLTELDVSQNTMLTGLDCYDNQLTSLDVSQNTALTGLYCYDNQLTELDVSQNTALTYLYCYDNQLTSLDMSQNAKLRKLLCYENQLTSLDVSQNTALTYLDCYFNQLTSLDVSQNTALTYLDCYFNQLTSLDVSNNTALEYLYCYENQLTELDVSQNTKLTTLACFQNQINGAAMDALVASLPTVSRGRLYVIYYENEQNEMTAEQVTAAKAKGWNTYQYDGSYWLEYSGKDVVGIAIDATNFPDANFRKYLFGESYGRDGVLTDAEIPSVTSINVSEKSIQTLKGIEYFTALTELKCDQNQLTELEVSQNTALQTLYCGFNQLTELDVSQNTALIYLSCHYNQLTELDVSQNTALRTLYCYSNQLTELDVSQNTALKSLSCHKNQLTSLDVSPNTTLRSLSCHDNQLTELDVSGCTALTTLECYNNRLTSLDASGCTALETLECYNNRLTSIDVSGCNELRRLYCYQNQIKGAAMDALVELHTKYPRMMYVIYYENEQNVMTTVQVALAKDKGCKAYEHNGRTWVEYAGSDPTGIVYPTVETEERVIIYDLSGRRLSKPQRGVNIVNGRKILK